MDITLERILSLIPCNENGRVKKGEAAKFAGKLGLPANIIAEWKAGNNKSYRKHVYQIAEKYDVSVDWLLGNTDIKKAPPEIGKDLTEAQKLFLEQIQDLTDEQLYKLINIVNEAKKLIL